ncbi:hypothetical protein [Leptothrix discophora]|uniref:Uncharacterized protein n=1 Tax=Leptothrix discophora TaxID=89 RepID=A0ABT9G8J4_LEPDI|nr:hypothetical protein [Leptothrix discophora]MDP4302794.1 hypothetical protein [Leptothrix discophora]
MNPNLASHVRGTRRPTLDLERGPALARVLSGAAGDLTPAVHQARPPGMHDLETLATWHISWHLGRYWFGPFCFDDLADAVRYARQQQAHAVPEVDD